MTKSFSFFISAPLAALLLLFAAVPTTHADIFQWEYINPADPSHGKRPSAAGEAYRQASSSPARHSESPMAPRHLSRRSVCAPRAMTF
jgi:hypothetical protein